MTPEAKQRIQWALAITIVVVGIRAAYILYERYSERAEEAVQASKKASPLNPDFYVVPKKLYPTDLKSAKQLTQQPVWVKEGYHHTYYPYDPARRRADFSREAGLLLPIQRLEVKDVVAEAAPHSAHLHQVMAVFEQDGKTYAVPIGSVIGTSYSIYSDDLFFIQDPHELYKHWPPDIWASIDQHQAKPGMNEFQVDFALGMGTLERSSDPTVQTVHYANGGKPLTIKYRDGKVAEIHPEVISGQQNSPTTVH